MAYRQHAGLPENATGLTGHKSYCGNIKQQDASKTNPCITYSLFPVREYICFGPNLLRWAGRRPLVRAQFHGHGLARACLPYLSMLPAGEARTSYGACWVKPNLFGRLKRVLNW